MDLTKLPSVWTLTALAVFSYLVYLLVLVVYRLTLHPLAKYPGPFLSRVSEWSIPVQCTTRDRHLILLREHQRYGPIVRIGPNTLSFSSPRSLRQIYQGGRDNNPLRKSAYYDTIDVPSGANSLHAESSRSKHNARRRMLEGAFTAGATRSNEPFITEAVDVLCKVLAPTGQDEWSPPRNMKEYFAWFAYDIMGALVFGRKFDCLTDPSHRYVPKLFITGCTFRYVSSNLPFNWLIRQIISTKWLMRSIGGDVARQEIAYVDYANECMATRLAKDEKDPSLNKMQPDGVERKDMMHYIIEGRRSAKLPYYGRKELDSDASMLIAAGSDTTSITLGAMFFYLTLPSSQNTLAKLVDEICDKSKFPNIESITGPAAAALPYLRACIDETLRLAPPLPVHLPRTVIPESGLEIGGEHIPAGIEVGVSAYVVQHDEEAYPRPWFYIPDRWILDEKPTPEQVEQLQKAKEAFVPFSLGSRGCIGKELAYREMCICAARLIYTFEFRRSKTTSISPAFQGNSNMIRAGLPTRENEYQLYDCFVADRDGPEIEFRRRNRFA